ncbi:hypothetical protein K402DRAFT_333172 [Aulographum hederae CBS 113979]|uniref:Uncharacterized protein n=1 Tax=Aulographum hederae CBS 113979 TaxID=1176131 RepID=A0A6G1GZJ2_9PEZI|nr:hypothetical protein K402DRAFT_333172 [Aulographum hederae CBS 113979]
MVQFIPPPNPRELLPPLLACLPTAFASRRPPPDLLPLLSPILRQKLQFISDSGSSSWLPLLCWDKDRAEKLPSIVEDISASLEPHPVSGEIELEDVKDIRYRKLDQETLQSRLDLTEFNLMAIYLWCMGDAHEWKLAELRGLEDLDDGNEWYSSMTEADEVLNAGYSRTSRAAPAITGQSTSTNGAATSQSYMDTNQDDEDDDDDDDDYWASYDKTPANRTPAKRPSPAPNTTNSTLQLPNQTELEYFARYMSEVQPAMDPHDPDEESDLKPGDSTLNGNTLVTSRQAQQQQPPQVEPLQTTNLGPAGYDSSLPPASDTKDARQDSHVQSLLSRDEQSQQQRIESPRASSPASARSVERLEQEAAVQAQAELGIKQHISTDIKSLFRLAKSAGIDRAEFERIVQTELQVLPLMDMEE